MAGTKSSCSDAQPVRGKESPGPERSHARCSLENDKVDVVVAEKSAESESSDPSVDNGDR